MLVGPGLTAMQACVSEVRAFARGGPAGLARLQQVLPNIFSHYGIMSRSQQASVLCQCGVWPASGKGAVTFELGDQAVFKEV